MIAHNGPMDLKCGPVAAVDPFRCRVCTLNARMAEHITEASCKPEIESFARHGQLFPVIGRRLQNDPDFDVEVICGARRLFVARHLKIPLLVDLRELTNQQAVIAIDAENSLRKRNSPYERSLWIATLMRQNVYRSQDEVARELGIPPNQITRLLTFAGLPILILDAFSSPHDILESWAIELHKAWHDERRKFLTERALAIQRRVPRPPAVSVYETLMASRGQVTRNRRATGRLVKSATAEPRDT
jgi:ParB family chromosome partitioning protein